jgi:hypothetical protein
MLKIRTVEYERRHEHYQEPWVSESKDCPQACGLRKGIPRRRVTQILMEILVRSEWVWLVRGPQRKGCTSGRRRQEWEKWTLLQQGKVLIFFTKSADRSVGERRSGQATPAVQRGSVPRMLLFGLYSSK